MIKWHVVVCEAQGSPKGPKLMIKGIKEALGRLREAQGSLGKLKEALKALKRHWKAQLLCWKQVSLQHWGEVEEKAFQDLKYAVEHVLVLSQPDWELEFQVACDASQDAVGAVLYQVTKDGLKKYVILYLKTLQVGQQNYLASKRELLTIVFSLKKFWYYLLGRKFVVETDYKALTYLNLSTLFMILDWLDFLLQYDFTIVFIKGMENVLPDFLSHCCVKEEINCGMMA